MTHDRTFLSSLATRIVELDRGTADVLAGQLPASTSRRRRRRSAPRPARSHRLDKKLEKEEAWLRQGVKARRTRNEGRVRDLLALREQRAAWRAQSGMVRMAIDATDTSGRLVFEADRVSKALGGIPVVRDFSQRILRGDRIGLIGPERVRARRRCCRLLVGTLAPDAGEVKQGARLQIAYFDQQRDELDPERTVADTVNNGNDTIVVNGESRHVIGYLADFLFPRERAQSPVKQLSGGERNRLMLARLFAQPRQRAAARRADQRSATSRRWSCSRSSSAASTAPCCSSATTGRSWTTS